MRNQRISQNGFTIIEILVVVVIIGILASIVVVSFNSTLRKSRETKVKADLTQIAKAVEALGVDTDRYPNGCPKESTANPEVMDLTTSVAGLLSRPPVGVVQAPCEWTAFAVSQWNGPYLKQVLVDPWNRNYFFDPDFAPYMYNSACPSQAPHAVCVVVGSFGPDGSMYNCDDFFIKLWQ